MKKNKKHGNIQLKSRNISNYKFAYIAVTWRAHKYMSNFYAFFMPKHRQKNLKTIGNIHLAYVLKLKNKKWVYPKSKAIEICRKAAKRMKIENIKTWTTNTRNFTKK